MYITEELLEEKGACKAGREWFACRYPEGHELDDALIADVKGCPTNFVWWFYNNVQQDKRLYALCGVNDSGGVNGSNGVNWSNGVNDSGGVKWSNGVNGSNGVNWSNGVNGSNGVNWSNGVNGSNGVNWSNGVNRSNGVSWSDGVNGSFGILNSFGVDCALFLADKARSYSIFGKAVSLNRYEEVRNQLYTLLDGWEPVFTNLKALWLKHGSKWEDTPIKDAVELSIKEAWEGMPRAAVAYVRSLPEFDAEMFEQITGISE